MAENTMVLMRGLPGSGKSTKAKLLFGEIYKYPDTRPRLHSSDHYFAAVEEPGEPYRFREGEFKHSHALCRLQVRRSMLHGCTPIIVDNTHTELWMMKTYVELADEFGYEIAFSYPDTAWAWNAQGCFEHCSHDVPIEKIVEMLCNFQGRGHSPLTLKVAIRNSEFPWVIRQRNEALALLDKLGGLGAQRVQLKMTLDGITHCAKTDEARQLCEGDLADQMAYLREELDEDELEDALSAFLPKTEEKIDA